MDYIRGLIPTRAQWVKAQVDNQAEQTVTYLEQIEQNLIEIYTTHRCSHPRTDPVCAMAANVLSLVWLLKGYVATQAGLLPLHAVELPKDLPLVEENDNNEPLGRRPTGST